MTRTVAALEIGYDVALPTWNYSRNSMARLWPSVACGQLDERQDQDFEGGATPRLVESAAELAAATK
jgi:hypothetical protein